MSPTASASARIIIGRLMAILAVGGWLLSLAAEVGGLPASLESSIRSNSAVWSLGSGALLIAGIRLLWVAGHPRTAWRPQVDGRRFRSVILYTRPDCSLCEKAAELLSAYRLWLPAPLEVNIDEDPQLRDQYNESVPVVEIDGKVRFRGSINEVLLRRLIEGTPPLRQRF